MAAVATLGLNETHKGQQQPQGSRISAMEYFRFLHNPHFAINLGPM